MEHEPDSIAQKEMGRRLQLVRDALEVTQEDFAKAAGVGLSAISAWEGGRNKIDVVKLGKISKTYGFATDYIIKDEIEKLTFELAKKVQLQMGLKASESTPRRGRPRTADAAPLPELAPDVPIRFPPPDPPRPPPGPPVGGSVGKRDGEDCRMVVRIPRGTRRAG
jgi:transcriptional regulator with XRE-family HTH domain